VDCQQGEFVWCENKTPEVSLSKNLSCLPPGTYSGLPCYQTELNTWITPWLKSVRDMLNSGVIFICDYGYQRELYYSQPRIRGTLQCYYKHHVHDNPLIYAGVQDITAHVDFTAVAEAAEQLGFTLDGFATQGNFLSKAGILDAYQDAQSGLNEREILRLNQEMKWLTLSTELAENFKVIALSYEYDEVIEAFDEIDVSYLL
jgi:SAM-dependent MidA family methyltransferase